ncbi:hypothetical protein ACFUOZ_00460 [Paenarthrobacter sp. NPDC057355]|uniref:hypothetical protein n=1 Tax=Paenarthrobacter sp. NPDC057355 TaxID=3346105 RepID=UPI00362F1F96
MVQATPDIFSSMLPALIGFCGVIVGGVLQVVAKHRADRYSHMMELRREVADLIVSVSGFATAIVQSAVWIDSVREDLKARLVNDPQAEADIDDDYHERLGEAMITGYRESAQKSARLLVASDQRIADHVGSLQLRLADVINEVGYMHAGNVHISEARAKEIQQYIMERINVLVNMVAPAKWERFSNFRSAKRAESLLIKERAKRL